MREWEWEGGGGDTIRMLRRPDVVKSAFNGQFRARPARMSGQNVSNLETPDQMRNERLAEAEADYLMVQII